MTKAPSQPRLFAIRETRSTYPITNLFFSDKFAAKKERDHLIATTGIPHVVTLGPDHWRAK